MAVHRFYTFVVNSNMYAVEETHRDIFHIIRVNHDGTPLDNGETGIVHIHPSKDEWFWGEENITELDKQEIMVRLIQAIRDDPKSFSREPKS